MLEIDADAALGLFPAAHGVDVRRVPGPGGEAERIPVAGHYGAVAEGEQPQLAGLLEQGMRALDLDLVAVMAEDPPVELQLVGLLRLDVAPGAHRPAGIEVFERQAGGITPRIRRDGERAVAT